MQSIYPHFFHPSVASLRANTAFGRTRTEVTAVRRRIGFKNASRRALAPHRKYERPGRRPDKSWWGIGMVTAEKPKALPKVVPVPSKGAKSAGPTTGKITSELRVQAERMGLPVKKLPDQVYGEDDDGSWGDGDGYYRAMIPATHFGGLGERERLALE